MTLKLNAELCTIFEIATKLQAAKALTYKDSWKKDGEFLSVFSNTARKYDRVRNVILAHVNEGKPLPEGDASIAAGVFDLMVYCGLWLTFIKEERPVEYQALLADIQKDVNDAEVLSK